MNIGIDVDIIVNRSEGYAVVDSRGRDTLDVNLRYLTTISNPPAWRNGAIIQGKEKVTPAYLYYDKISYKELWEMFENKGDGIKSFCDFDNCPIKSPSEYPDFHDFANLAQILHIYGGLE